MNYSEEDLFEIKKDLLLNNELSKYEELKDVQDYLYLFRFNGLGSNNFQKLIDFLLNYKEQIKKLDIEFIKRIIGTDLINYTTYTYHAYYALGIYLDRNYINFNRDYYDSFNILLQTINDFQEEQDYFNEFSKYASLMKDISNITLNCNHVLDYNFHVLSRYIVAYAYYNNQLNIDDIKKILFYFINNYNCIINLFEVNGLTDKDYCLDFNKLDYVLKFCIDNYDKNTFKKVLK